MSDRYLNSHLTSIITHQQPEETRFLQQYLRQKSDTLKGIAIAFKACQNSSLLWQAWLGACQLCSRHPRMVSLHKQSLPSQALKALAREGWLAFV